MKKNTKNRENGNKVLYLVIVIVVFVLAFVLLINKQNKNTYLADIADGNFAIKSEAGSVIVAKDTYTIHPKYYVVYVNSNKQYSIYVYNYYETTSQYELEFNRLLDKIVDYNAKDKMIRYLHSKGYGTYNEILVNLPILVDNQNIQIY